MKWMKWLWRNFAIPTIPVVVAWWFFGPVVAAAAFVGWGVGFADGFLAVRRYLRMVAGP